MSDVFSAAIEMSDVIADLAHRLEVAIGCREPVVGDTNLPGRMLVASHIFLWALEGRRRQGGYFPSPEDAEIEVMAAWAWRYADRFFATQPPLSAESDNSLSDEGHNHRGV